MLGFTGETPRVKMTVGEWVRLFFFAFTLAFALPFAFMVVIQFFIPGMLGNVIAIAVAGFIIIGIACVVEEYAGVDK